MEGDAETTKQGNKSWRYRIYLVGFPMIDADSNTIPMVEMIRNLVPEAYILQHNIFRSDVTSHIRPDDEKDDDLVEGSNHYPSGDDGRVSSIDTTHSREISVCDRHDSDDQSVTVVLNSEEIHRRPNMGNDSIYLNSAATHNFFTAAWIQNEALDLLGRIKQRAPVDYCGCRSKVILAGYGFGGIIVKQAVIIANTMPQFYDTARNIASLGFFATPHRSTGRLAWEELLLSMLRATKMGYSGRLSQILSALVDSVSQLSHVFYQFAAKYHITNFIRAIVKGGSDDALEINILDNAIEEIVLWPTTSYDGLALCSTENIDKLRSLREHFAPRQVLSCPYEGVIRHGREASEKEVMDVYFETLQCLSPSRWILYENRTLDKPDDYNDLMEVYGSLLQGVDFVNNRGGSIQVTGPSGYGKSAVVKLVSQKIRRTSPVVIIDNIISSVQRLPPTLYDVQVSFIHQIISQRPSLFHPVQDLMSQVLRHNAWTEETVHSILSSMFNHSQNVDYLIVVYDFERWPSEIQSWWLKIDNVLLECSSSTCTLLTSSLEFMSKIKNAKVHHIDLTKRHESYRSALIKTKATQLLDHGYGPTSLQEGLSNNITEKIISSANSYKGSFSSINTYLLRLFQTFSVSSLKAIEQSVSEVPRSEDELYMDCINVLKQQPLAILNWALPLISWMLRALRPLRLEELAVAAAINMSHSTWAEIQSTISLDMERDIRNHLGGLVVLENRHARIISPLAREILSDVVRSQLNLETDYTITQRCLHYLRLVLGDERPEVWGQCLSRLSYKYLQQRLRDPVLGLLDYACRFWPTHFQQAADPDGSLKEQVATFFRDSEVSGRWFKLWFLSNAASSSYQYNNVNCVDTPSLSNFPKRAGFLFAEAKTSTEPDESLSPAKMAGQVGLESIVHSLAADEEIATERKVVRVRRGYAEHEIVFLGTSSRSYLDYAITNGYEDVVKELLLFHKDSTIEKFPLHRAALVGRLEMMKLLVNLPDPAQVDDLGRTPLHMAAIGGHANIIHYLVGSSTLKSQSGDSGATIMINAADRDHQTPLITATRLGNADAAMALVNLGAKINVRDETGKTALHYAILHCPQLVEAFVTQDRNTIYMTDNSDRLPLHVAAQAGNTKSAMIITNTARISERLLDTVDIYDALKKTPLHYAAENGHAEIAGLLMQAGPHPSGKDIGNMPASLAAVHGHLATLKAITRGMLDAGDRLLIDAAGAGQLLIVQYLLEENISPDGMSGLPTTPLSAAAANDHHEVVRTLLKANADINLEDADRATALHHAVRHGMYNAAQVLLNYQSNTAQTIGINTPDSSRYTPLHYAAKEGHVRIVELLLNHHASIDARSQRGETPLHLAVQRPEIVEMLLDAGADANCADIDEQTPLHMAAIHKSVESVKLLIGHGSDIEACDSDGQLPITHAISRNSLDVVKELYKGDLEEQSSELASWKNLELAVKDSSLAVLEFLVSLSKDAVKMTDSRKRTLLHIAAQQDDIDILTFLLKCGLDANSPGRWNRTPFHEAASVGNIDNMRKLLEWGAKADKGDEDSETPLYTAAERGDIDTISFLLNMNVDIENAARDGTTPLYIAAYRGNLLAVKTLIDAGANVGVTSSQGWTILHASVDNLELTQLLVQFFPNVDIKKADGWTPLHLSASWGYLDIVKLLLENGADPNLVNSDDETPMHVALDNGNISIAHTLLNIEKSVDLDRRVLVSAYWKAIKMNNPQDVTKEQLDFVELLTKRDDTLLTELSEGSFNGLQTILRLESPQDEYNLMAVCLVKLGIDPFFRKQKDQRSAFELAIISRGGVAIEFFEACLQFLRDNPQVAQDLGFREIRIITEFDRVDLWQELKPLREWLTSGETDQDNWSIDHFYYQTSDRLPNHWSWDIEAIQKPTMTSQSLVMPEMWHSPETIASDRLQILPGGLEVLYGSSNLETDRLDICVRADFPFPPKQLGQAYFEITIQEYALTDSNDPSALGGETLDPIISIGFSGEFCNQKNAHPGWCIWSVGYHGDDGGIYEHSDSPKCQTNQTFGIGSNIGCGIDYDSGFYFFTLNGEVVIKQHSLVIFRKLYPCVGHVGGACKVSVNFGKTDFVWPVPKRLSQSNQSNVNETFSGLKRTSTYRDWNPPVDGEI